MPISWTGVNMWGADAKGESVFDSESSMQRTPPSGAVYMGARNRRKSDSPRRYRRRTGRRQRGVYSGRRSTGTVPRQVCGPRRREQRCPSCRRSRRVKDYSWVQLGFYYIILTTSYYYGHSNISHTPHILLILTNF